MLTTDRVAGAVLVALGLAVTWESLWSARRLPLGTLRMPGPAYLPVALAILLIVFGVAVLALGGRALKMADTGWSEWRHTAGIVATCAGAAYGLERFGYRLTMTMVLVVLLGAVERRHPLFAVPYALALAFGSFALFDTLLRVPLPRGPFGF